MTPARRLQCALFVSSVVGAAHAAGPGASVRLEVSAPPECTSEADLKARVLARLRRDSFDERAEALAVRARFTTLPSGSVSAELTLRKPGATPSSRRLVARSCQQAADAAALIVAVTLDPTSLSAALPATPETSPGEPENTAAPSPSSASETQPARVSDDEHGRAGQKPLEPRPAPTAPEPAEPADTAGAARFGAHVAAQVLGGVAPKLMPSVALYASAGVDRAGPWSPAAMLGIAHGFDTSVEAQGGTAAFWLDALSLDACALRLQWRAFETRACASAMVGRLSANGTETGNAPGVVRRPFAATGATALFVLRASSLVEFTARGAGSVNLYRDSFEFAPFVFHTVPRLSFAASIGVGLRSR